MGGWKTIAFSVATALLGILDVQAIHDVVAAHPGPVMVAFGVVTGILRFITTSAIFKG